VKSAYDISVNLNLPTLH